MSEGIGRISQERYEQILAGDREGIGQMVDIKFTIGDHALEIEPVRPRGGSRSVDDCEPGVAESPQIYADDLGIALSTIIGYRSTANRWPAERRRAEISFNIHLILAYLPDETARFAAIDNPPLDPKVGYRRWTADLARIHLGNKPSRPVTVPQKVTAIHNLAQDDEVAAQIATDVLRRPAVAKKVMADGHARHMVNKAQTTQQKAETVLELTEDETVAAQVAADVLRRPEVAARVVADDTTRHLVNKAQTDRSRQQAETFRRETPVGQTVRKIEHTEEFLELIGACHKFVSVCSKKVPKLRNRQLTEHEQGVLTQNLSRVRATIDWVETAAATGEVDMDAELTRLLRGE
jgi:antitoxin component of MazEF toxin-antitoxin module